MRHAHDSVPRVLRPGALDGAAMPSLRNRYASEMATCRKESKSRLSKTGSPSRMSPQGVTPISQLLEALKGKGRLVSNETPPADYQVEYEFRILTTIEERPGSPQGARKKASRGQVSALDGRSIPSGKYQLQAEGGAIIQVQNWGTVWTILAS